MTNAGKPYLNKSYRQIETFNLVTEVETEVAVLGEILGVCQLQVHIDMENSKLRI